MKHTAHLHPNSNKPSPESSHHEILVHNGKHYTGTDQLGKLCRDLKTGSLTVYRGTTPAYTVKNVAARADKSLTENKHTGFRLVKYMEFDVRGMQSSGV